MSDYTVTRENIDEIFKDQIDNGNSDRLVYVSQGKYEFDGGENPVANISVEKLSYDEAVEKLPGNYIVDEEKTNNRNIPFLVEKPDFIKNIEKGNSFISELEKELSYRLNVNIEFEYDNESEYDFYYVIVDGIKHKTKFQLDHAISEVKNLDSIYAQFADVIEFQLRYDLGLVTSTIG